MLEKQMKTYIEIQDSSDRDFAYINKQINQQRNEFLKLEAKMAMEVQPRFEQDIGTLQSLVSQVQSRFKVME